MDEGARPRQARSEHQNASARRSHESLRWLVYYYRPPASKDAPGWKGRAVATDSPRIARGVVSV
eukprot:9136927-Lingulodinium_polyedra.AAC.1